MKCHKIVWDFEIQTEHLIPIRRLDPELIKKRICHLVDFAVPADYRVKIKENEKINSWILPESLKSYET